MRTCLLVMKALSDPTRLRIIQLLASGEMCVCQIVAVLGMGQSTVSQHLGILRRAGLVLDRKKTRWVFYRLTDDNGHQQGILEIVMDWSKEDPKIIADKHMRQRVERFSPDELCRGDLDEMLERKM